MGKSTTRGWAGVMVNNNGRTVLDRAHGYIDLQLHDCVRARTLAEVRSWTYRNYSHLSVTFFQAEVDALAGQ